MLELKEKVYLEDVADEIRAVQKLIAEKEARFLSIPALVKLLFKGSGTLIDNLKEYPDTKEKFERYKLTNSFEDGDPELIKEAVSELDTDLNQGQVLDALYINIEKLK